MVKFSIYLNRCVFVICMCLHTLLRGHYTLLFKVSISMDITFSNYEEYFSLILFISYSSTRLVKHYEAYFALWSIFQFNIFSYISYITLVMHYEIYFAFYVYTLHGSFCIPSAHQEIDLLLWYRFSAKIKDALVSYSRLSLSRIPRDSLKYFEIFVLRHIRFAELRKN